MMPSSESVAVRRAIATYLSGELTLERLYEVVASATGSVAIDTPDAAVVHRTYGLLVDHHAGLLGADALHDELRPLVTSYSLVWSLMAESTSVVTSSQVVFTSQPSIQRPLLRVFDTRHEAVSG